MRDEECYQERVLYVGGGYHGKSTLLHLAAGLDVPDRGEILLGGERLSALDETRRSALRRQRRVEEDLLLSRVKELARLKQATKVLRDQREASAEKSLIDQTRPVLHWMFATSRSLVLFATLKFRSFAITKHTMLPKK